MIQDELALEKAKKYLIKLKKSRLIKKPVELEELKNTIEKIDSIIYQIRIERNSKNGSKS